jgi:hypothetical protein
MVVYRMYGEAFSVTQRGDFAPVSLAHFRTLRHQGLCCSHCMARRFLDEALL